MTSAAPIRKPPGWVYRLTAHIPPGQFGRYLLVGGWNTLFGYVVYAALTATLQPALPHAYFWAFGISSLLSISVAFLGYKWLVFRTKGNYLKEWTRCLTVYGSGIAVSAILLPILVESLRHIAGMKRSAPYLGGALLTGLGVLYNFFGHRKFSFRVDQ